ncbi:acetoin dehydrogenase [Nocardia sp. 852002-20019_SCH5090214]|jgi:NADP-dependent 3-hydroxy acid dehydrogenase YdfG|uniref:KR domain-containing protein n=2 Tax=Nocardia TaxID=1817 RepID=A0A2S5ZWG7_9NOCA|nr:MULTISPECIES: SDR family NAD(P)-dependent oxidoreductase [Nocardia]MDN2495319.1 SDR family NAD(P)-dependent oxidoreductase [Nocardia nova]OBA50089.1 acetoin dehydrogenase [Nocardia sp. 852002-20019_SCH5090214]OXR40623.1 putative oxidoreductase SadH [Nocardia cerradoensis]PPJ10788.1 KR domain-containing protein [Nocardia nova]PPJ17376.1 KR domain-containing protein [Nocardia nova]
MKDFGDRVVSVTGAGSGIGRAIALRLAGEGARLALADLDAERAEETAAMCGASGAESRHYKLDVADRLAFENYRNRVVEDFGSVSMVINNAGVALGADVLEMDWNDFEWLISINFWGVVNGTKLFLPDLIESGDGHVVNVSSVFGLMAIPSQSAYNASKFAVRGFTEALRQEMRIGRLPVGVTCVHPGGVRTNIVRNARGVGEIGDQQKIVASFDRIALTTPDRAAEQILRGVRRNRPRVLVGPDAVGFDFVTRVVGPRYQDLNAPLARLGYAIGRRSGLMNSES